MHHPGANADEEPPAESGTDFQDLPNLFDSPLRHVGRLLQDNPGMRSCYLHACSSSQCCNLSRCCDSLQYVLIMCLAGWESRLQMACSHHRACRPGA